jgi:hypothetical protein
VSDAGKLNLRIDWDGQLIRKVDIDSSRPQAFRLMNGRTPESAVQMARLLFNVCGNAQGAAAAAAIAAAQGGVLADRAAPQRRIACEAMQEHLWRLLLDWPKLLDMPQPQADFVRWHGSLRGIAAGQGDMGALRAELEARWLGMPAAEWLKLARLSELQHWWHAADSPAARLLQTLDAIEAESTQDGNVAVLPDWTAQQALQACGDHLDADFCAQPHYHGVAAETGALGYHALSPLLRDVLCERPSRVLARVLARVCDALFIVTERDPDRLDAVQAADGSGMAAVRTARGLLLHRVRLAAGRVQNYLTVAPTEWNFHPRGALTAGLQGLQVGARSRLAQLAGLHVLSLDPCVEYAISINGSAA